MSGPGSALMRALHDEHAGALWSFALRLTSGDRGRAEDIVQETLLRAWRNLDSLDDPAGDQILTADVVTDDRRHDAEAAGQVANRPAEQVGMAGEVDRDVDHPLAPRGGTRSWTGSPRAACRRAV